MSFICPELSGANVRVFEDNQGPIALAEDPLSSAGSKHIDVRSHFVTELLRSKNIDIHFVSSEEQQTRSTIEVAHFRYFVSERRGSLTPKSWECQS